MTILRRSEVILSKGGGSLGWALRSTRMQFVLLFSLVSEEALSKCCATVDHFQWHDKPTCLRESKGLRLNLRVFTTTESLILNTLLGCYDRRDVFSIAFL